MLRLFKNAGIILMVLLSLIQLYDWYKQLRKGELTATINHGVFKLPGGLDSEFRRIYALTSTGTLDSANVDFVKRLAGEDYQRVAARITSNISVFLRRQLPPGVPADYSRLSGYWTATVRNEQTVALKNVIITLPNTTRVLIRRQGEAAKEMPSTDVIQMGDLQPREEVTIFAWASVAPSSMYFGDIKLTHESGIGRVSILAPVGQIGQWMDQHGSQVSVWIASVSVLLLLILGFACIEARLSSFSRKPPKIKHPLPGAS